MVESFSTKFDPIGMMMFGLYAKLMTYRPRLVRVTLVTPCASVIVWVASDDGAQRT